MRQRVSLVATAALVVAAFGGIGAAAAQERVPFTLPLEPTVAGSPAGLVLGGIVDWLTGIVRDYPAAPRIEVAAPVHAVVSGPQVVVTFPGLALVWDDGTRVDAGDVVIPVTPREGGVYDFAAALPARYEIHDPDGATVEIMTVGESAVAVSWSAADTLLTAFEAGLRDIAVVNQGTGAPRLSVAAVDLQQTLGPGTADSWRGSLEAEVSEVRGGEVGAAADGEFAIERLDLVVGFEDVTAHDWRQLSGDAGLLGLDDATPPAPTMRFSVELGLAGMLIEEPSAATGAIGEARLHLDLGRKEPDLWNIGADVDLSGLSVSGFGGGEEVTIGEIGARSQTVDFPLPYWRELTERFGRDPGAPASETGAPTTEEFARSLGAVRWGTSTSEFAVADLSFGSAAAPTFALDRGSLGVEFDGREALVNARYRLRAESLFIANAGVPQELLPREAEIDVTLRDLPPAALVLPTMSGLGGESGGDALLGAFLGEVLTAEQPPAITFETLHYDAEALGVSASGRVAADLETPGGFRGEFNAALRDLAGFETFVASAERDGAAWAGGALGAECVAALREVGEAVPPEAEDPRPVHRYHISVTSDGNAIANGVPWAALVAGCTAPVGDGEWQEERAAAFAALDAGDSATAEQHLKAALEAAERTTPPDAPARIDSLVDLGIFYAEQGRSGEGAALLEQAVALRERTVGPDHPDLAFTLWWLGRASADLGQADAAESHYLRALAIDEQALGRGSLDVAWDLDALAVLYRDQARYPEAEAAFERLMAIAEAKLTEADADLARFLEDYAALKRATGRAAEADKMEARARAIRAR